MQLPGTLSNPNTDTGAYELSNPNTIHTNEVPDRNDVHTDKVSDRNIVHTNKDANPLPDRGDYFLPDGDGNSLPIAYTDTGAYSPPDVHTNTSTDTGTYTSAYLGANTGAVTGTYASPNTRANLGANTC